MLNRDDIHDYQRRAVDFIKDNPKAALWIDMGLGKTVSTLTALSDLIDQKVIKKTLIIAPLRVSNHTWPTEIHNWKHTRALNYTILSGLTPKKREAAIDEDTDIHIINRENIPWLVEQLGQRWHYDMVVIDESSSFKSHTSKRWKSLRKILGKVSRMVLLTGTPAPNSLLELWPQFYLLDKGERLEKTRGKFLSKYCTAVGNPQWNQWAVKPDRADAIHSAVSDIALVMSAEDYLQLPQRIDISVEVDLPPAARNAYEEMKSDFMIAYTSGEILAVNAAVQVGKLLQIANGNVYTEDGEYLRVHREKYDALDDIIESTNEPILIAYTFKSDLAELRLLYPDSEVIGKDPTVIDRWNAGEIPILFAHPASAGHGLNLQKGGSILVWFGLTWSLELYQQFNARLHRQGQEKPVRVFHIVARNTADRSVLDALSSKKVTQDMLLSVVESLS
jgi:SNF2 family DNA or RNA helicase